MSSKETMQFQAETRQLLDLMIHSIYSNKEIFLRELISNASDAIDKLRFEALTRPELVAEQLQIRLETDRNQRSLTLIDNGIGMNREEVISHIGTIAKSGTREMLNKIKENQSEQALELIGQFGVGFYSAFMVADKITLHTRRAGESEGWLWESTGDGSYTLSELPRETHGTSITLFLKEASEDTGIEDFTDPYVISRIVKKYSDFINYPIVQKKEVEKTATDADGQPLPDAPKVKVEEETTLNSMKPIWVRPKSEVKEEEYIEFYKHISHDWNEPLKTISYRAEGRLEYQALLFIPGKAPFDFYYHSYEGGLQLYVKRVMIMDSFKDLLPRYLRFARGVVDSSDLPLNISREILQQDKIIGTIRKAITAKIIDSLRELLEKEREQYLGFWKEFGPAIKEGVSSDYENREKLQGLLLFESSLSDGQLITLQEYVDRMKAEQKEIYYLAGESKSVLDNSPHMEAFKEKGVEVLYLLEPIDEIVMQNMFEFIDKSFKPASQGKADLDTGAEKEKNEKELAEKSKDYADLLAFYRDKLSAQVKDVKLSSHLVSAPSCLTSDGAEMSPQLERLLQQARQGGPKIKRILELNPGHEIVKKLQDRFKQNSQDPVLADYGELLLDYALLAEGAELPDPVRFNRLVAELMARGL